MQGLFRRVRTRLLRNVERWTKVKRDPHTGFYVYKRNGTELYIRSRKDYRTNLDWERDFRGVYFAPYFPQNGDTVVDFGAGFGEEAIFIRADSPDVRYIGVEIQPSIYECLSNTCFKAGNNFVAAPYAVSSSPDIKIASSDYVLNVSSMQEGYISIPTLTWDEFVARYGLDRIDLLKINIEGGETELLRQITDYSKIPRIIISVHDFRADKGHGEHFRTLDQVQKILEDKGYRFDQVLEDGFDWALSWYFASRSDANM